MLGEGLLLLCNVGVSGLVWSVSGGSPMPSLMCI